MNRQTAKKQVLLRSIQICQDGISAVGAVCFDKDFMAEIEYEVKTAVFDVNIVLSVVSEFRNNCL